MFALFVVAIAAFVLYLFFGWWGVGALAAVFATAIGIGIWQGIDEQRRRRQGWPVPPARPMPSSMRKPDIVFEMTLTPQADSRKRGDRGSDSFALGALLYLLTHRKS